LNKNSDMAFVLNGFWSARTAILYGFLFDFI
jgi:hypothetical protein